MEPGQEEEEEALVAELKRKLEDEDLNPEQRIHLLYNGLNKVLNMAALNADGSALTRVRSRLYLSGVLSHCVLVLDPRGLRDNWSAAAALAQLASSCCVGVELGKDSETFHRLFLPSILDRLLSLASQLARRAECLSLFRRVMDSLVWLLSAHTQLIDQVLGSVHYQQVQLCDDVTVSLRCVQLWIHTCSSSRDFVSRLSNNSVLLLLNQAVSQLAVSPDSTVGGASVRLILLLANQQELRVHRLLLSFRGLDSLLDKDWRGRGLDPDVNQLIAFIQSDKSTKRVSEDSTERVRAACVIQAAWRSFQTRHRVKSLSKAVITLQRRFRARRMRQQHQWAEQQLEAELKYQVCVGRQQARRDFHQRQRRLLQLLPAEQVQPYLQECERRAAVMIQSCWRGWRERQHYNNTHRHTLRQQQAARTLQRAVRLFLHKGREAKAPPTSPLWIGQTILMDDWRVELQTQVEDYVTSRPPHCVSRQESERLHEEAQLLLQAELWRGAERRRRQEERMEALLAHTHTQLELLRDAPPLSVVTATDAESFLSPSGPVAARARAAHNAALQANRLPWWRTPQEADTFSPSHRTELEAEFGGLFIGREGAGSTG